MKNRQWYVESERVLALGDRNHAAYPVADPADDRNRLTVRDTRLGQRLEIPRSRWRFARLESAQKAALVWPIAQDNDFTTWNRYSNRYWPMEYLIDKDGVIRYTHIGEGAYAETEDIIRELLAES